MFVNLRSVRRVSQADAAVISFDLFLFSPPCLQWPTHETKMVLEINLPGRGDLVRLNFIYSFKVKFHRLRTSARSNRGFNRDLMASSVSDINRFESKASGLK